MFEKNFIGGCENISGDSFLAKLVFAVGGTGNTIPQSPTQDLLAGTGTGSSSSAI